MAADLPDPCDLVSLLQDILATEDFCYRRADWCDVSSSIDSSSEILSFGTQLLRQGCCTENIHDFFRNFEFRRCCVCLTGGQSSSKAVHSLNDVRIADRHGIIADVNSCTIETVVHLTEQDFRVFSSAMLCASCPLLTVPEFFDEDNCGLSPTTSRTAEESPRLSCGFFDREMISRSMEEDFCLISSDILQDVVKSAFNLSAEAALSYSQQICEQYRKKKEAKILAEDLLYQLSLLETRRHPYYAPERFKSHQAYEQWCKLCRPKLLELINKFWHLSLPPLGSRPRFMASNVHADYTDLLHRLIRYEQRQKQLSNSDFVCRSRLVLSGPCERLLCEYSLRYGIDKVYRQAAVLQFLVSNFELSVPAVQRVINAVCDLQCLLPDKIHEAILVQQQIDSLKHIFQSLVSHCEQILGSLNQLPTMQLPISVAEFSGLVIEMCRKALEMVSYFSPEQSAHTLQQFVHSNVIVNFSQSYRQHRDRVCSDLGITCGEQTSPQLVNRMMTFAKDYVICYTKAFGNVLSSFMDVKQCSTVHFYQLLMEDVVLLCKHAQSKPPNPTASPGDLSIIGLMFRLNNLDKEWSCYISAGKQVWRYLFVDILVNWFCVIENRSLHFLIQALSIDKFVPLRIILPTRPTPDDGSNSSCSSRISSTMLPSVSLTASYQSAFKAVIPSSSFSSQTAFDKLRQFNHGGDHYLSGGTSASTPCTMTKRSLQNGYQRNSVDRDQDESSTSSIVSSTAASPSEANVVVLVGRSDEIDDDAREKNSGAQQQQQGVNGWFNVDDSPDSRDDVVSGKNATSCSHSSPASSPSVDIIESDVSIVQQEDRRSIGSSNTLSVTSAAVSLTDQNTSEMVGVADEVVSTSLSQNDNAGVGETMENASPEVCLETGVESDEEDGAAESSASSTRRDVHSWVVELLQEIINDALQKFAAEKETTTIISDGAKPCMHEIVQNVVNDECCLPLANGAIEEARCSHRETAVETVKESPTDTAPVPLGADDKCCKGEDESAVINCQKISSAENGRLPKATDDVEPEQSADDCNTVVTYVEPVVVVVNPVQPTNSSSALYGGDTHGSKSERRTETPCDGSEGAICSSSVAQTGKLVDSCRNDGLTAASCSEQQLRRQQRLRGASVLSRSLDNGSAIPVGCTSGSDLWTEDAGRRDEARPARDNHYRPDIIGAFPSDTTTATTMSVRFPASLVDVLCLMHRFIRVAEVFVQTLCCDVHQQRSRLEIGPVVIGKVAFHSCDSAELSRSKKHSASDLKADAETTCRTLSDVEKLDTQYVIWCFVAQALESMVCTYARNLLVMDLCGLDNATAVRLVGEGIVNDVRRAHQNKKNSFLWGCRHKRQGISCRSKELSSDPVTREMCIRINVAAQLDKVLGHLCSRINEVWNVDSSFGFSCDDTNVYLQNVSTSLINILAYRVFLHVNNAMDQVLTVIYSNLSERLIVDGSVDLTRSVSVGSIHKPTENSRQGSVGNRLLAESTESVTRSSPASSFRLERRTTNQSSMSVSDSHARASPDARFGECSHRRPDESEKLSSFAFDFRSAISLLNVSMQPILDFLTQRLVSLKLWLHANAFQLIIEALSMHIAEGFEKRVLDLQYTNPVEHIELHAKILQRTIALLTNFGKQSITPTENQFCSCLADYVSTVTYWLQLYDQPTQCLTVMYHTLRSSVENHVSSSATKGTTSRRSAEEFACTQTVANVPDDSEVREIESLWDGSVCDPNQYNLTSTQQREASTNDDGDHDDNGDQWSQMTFPGSLRYTARANLKTSAAAAVKKNDLTSRGNFGHDESFVATGCIESQQLFRHEHDENYSSARNVFLERRRINCELLLTIMLARRYRDRDAKQFLLDIDRSPVSKFPWLDFRQGPVFGCLDL